MNRRSLFQKLGSAAAMARAAGKSKPKPDLCGGFRVPEPFASELIRAAVGERGRPVVGVYRIDASGLKADNHREHPSTI